MKAQQRYVGVLVALVFVSLVAACGGAPEPQSTPKPEATSTPTVTPTPTATTQAKVFTQPTDCTVILPETRLSEFAGAGLSLLGGPGGSKFGASYFAEKTPEELAGGITCVWGEDSSDFSSFVISVASLSPANRPGVVGELLGLGLNETSRDGTQEYWIIGDGTAQPAQFNAIRAESWISVISTAGGQAAFDVASAIAAEVAGLVYQAG